MFTTKSFADEIAESMENYLVDGTINKRAEVQSRIVKAADFLNAAAEIFDESGMTVQAEVITAVLESLAAKKKKSKPSKKPDKKPSALTSEKMVNNLKEKGWMFDKSDSSDQNHADTNCAACGSDLSQAKDKDRRGEKDWFDISHPIEHEEADLIPSELDNEAKNSSTYDMDFGDELGEDELNFDDFNHRKSTPISEEDLLRDFNLDTRRFHRR